MPCLDLGSRPRIDRLDRGLFLSVRVDVEMIDPDRLAVLRSDLDSPSPVRPGWRGIRALNGDRSADRRRSLAGHDFPTHVPGVNPVPGDLADLGVESQEQRSG